MQVPHLCASCTRPSSSRASSSWSSSSSRPHARPYPRQQKWLGRRIAPEISSAFRVEKYHHHHHRQLGEHDMCTSRCRRRKTPLPLWAVMRPADSAAPFYGNSISSNTNNNNSLNSLNSLSNSRFVENYGCRPTLSASSEGTDEGDSAVGGGGGGGGNGGVGGGARGSKKTRAENKKEKKNKSVLGKAGDAAKTTFNALMAAGTVASLLLAAETLWELHGT
ncbi:unnamed protein product, partial [Laminaria digitata]